MKTQNNSSFECIRFEGTLQQAICSAIDDWYLEAKELLKGCGAHNLGYMKENLKLVACEGMNSSLILFSAKDIEKNCQVLLDDCNAE